MKRTVIIASACAIVAAGLFAASPSLARFVGLFVADLSGDQEVSSVSTTGNGSFFAWVDDDSIEFRLSYADLEGGEVHQAHIHFAQKRVNGGVSVFLCSNLPSAPAGTQPCPDSPATITGTIDAADVVGPAAQGIDPGEFDELLAAIKKGLTYVNVHTEDFMNGEIRGQIKRGTLRR